MSLSRFLADDKSLVAYRPKLNAATGCPLSTIVLQQVLYWYEKAGRRPFYKFKEPCKHKSYNPGDSWCEEIGFTRPKFDTALRRISQKVAKGKKKDKNALIWYWTGIDRMTYYEVNIPRLDAILAKIYIKQESDFTKSGKDTLPIAENPLYEKQESDFRYKTETNKTETNTERGEETPAEKHPVLSIAEKITSAPQTEKDAWRMKYGINGDLKEQAEAFAKYWIEKNCAEMPESSIASYCAKCNSVAIKSGFERIWLKNYQKFKNDGKTRKSIRERIAEQFDNPIWQQ